MKVVTIVTLYTIATSAGPLPALTSAAKIPFVKEIACVPFLAEPFQPVFADKVVG